MRHGADSLLTAIEFTDGTARLYQYDDSGLLTQVTASDSSVTALSYSGGLLDTITEPGGRTVTHDGAANLISLVDENGSTRDFGYDGSNRMTVDQWTPWASSFSYDSDGLLIDVNLGSLQNYIISSAAQLHPTTHPGVATMEDGRWNTTTYGVDAVGRLLAEVQPNGLSQTSTYDSHGQATTYTDQSGLTTSYMCRAKL